MKLAFPNKVSDGTEVEEDIGSEEDLLQQHHQNDEEVGFRNEEDGSSGYTVQFPCTCVISSRFVITTCRHTNRLYVYINVFSSIFPQ